MVKYTPRILCVCLGNICRSPMAEAVLRARLPEARIDSAATADLHLGECTYGPAIEAAARRGYGLDKRPARLVRPQDFHAFDVILAMDASNLTDLHARAPASRRARLDLFRAPCGGGDVPDPYYTGDFDGVLSLIEEAAAAWADQLLHSSSAV